MARLQNPLSDYDRAIRALDSKNYLDFIHNSSSENLLEKRKNLVKKLRYYRNPHHMEDYQREYFKIQTKLSGIVNFEWKHAQKIFWYHHVLPKILNKEPVRIYLLKARQIGFSTLIEAIGTAFCCLFSDISSAVVAHDIDTSGKIHRMCKLYYKSLPKNFKPCRKLSNRKELQLANPNEGGELGLESSFSVNTARNLHLGAGTTLRFIHLSEFARYEEVNSEAENALADLFQTIPEKGGTFIFIETTAYGEGIGKRFWDNPDNGFDKVFVSFIAEPTYTLSEPLKDSLGFDTSHKYGDELLAKDQIIEELKKWYPNKSEDLEWVNHEAYCRLGWRRKYIDEKSFGKVDLFQQNYPLTPEEAFRISGKSVFNTYILLQKKKTAETIEPQRFTFVKDRNIKKLGRFEPDKFGHLKVFGPIRDDRLYFLGIDVGAGLSDSDPSVIQVFDNFYNQHAILRDVIEPDDLAYPAALLARTYNNARIIPEDNSHGVSLISRLVKDIGYSNIHIRKKINRIDGSITQEWGFHTDRKTRPILINTLRRFLSSYILNLYDIETIHEFLNFAYVMKGNIIRMEANPGQHDDTVLAAALAIIDIEDFVSDMEENITSPPIGSIEHFAQQVSSETSDNLFSSFGSVIGC